MNAENDRTTGDKRRTRRDARVDVLIPTINRPQALVMTLAGVAGQTVTNVRVIVADQSKRPMGELQVVQALRRVIAVRGGVVEWHHRDVHHGIAEQRDFLLRRAASDAVLFLDDDVYLEPWVLSQLLQTLREEECGFVGTFPVGMSYRDDVRPNQQDIEYWTGPVEPEVVEPGSAEWERYHLHRAANLYHVSCRLDPGEVRRYKVAWVGACCLYDRHKLLAVGGFSFWPRLPRHHSGEEVLVQNLLMRRWGGCAIIPSGAYHAEVPSTVLNDAGTVEGHALDLLDEMVARYAPVHERRKPVPSGTGEER